MSTGPHPAASVSVASTTRWRVKPALRALWRDGSNLQLGITPAHAVVLSGLTPADRSLLDLLDGSRDRAAVVGAASAAGLPTQRVNDLLDSLADAGVLDDAAANPLRLPENQRQQLEPDLASLSLRHRQPGAAVRVLERRRQASVSVHGTGRVGATLVGLLAAAGIGRIGCVDTAPVRPADLAPGGIADVGQTRADATVAHARRVAPSAVVDAGLPADPLLAVVTPAGGLPAPEVVSALRHRPHLLAGVSETTAFIGPLVLPGRTPCLRCLAIGRGDRDPVWPALAAQLVSDPAATEACDVVLATLAAAHAALETLAWVDGERPATVGGILELRLDDARLRRRSVTAHPGCGCGAAD